MTLAAPTADHGPLAVEQCRTRDVDPPGLDFAVPVDELHEFDVGQTFLSRSRPALRARAAVKIDVSRSTTSAPMDRAIATLSSLEPEST